MSRSESQDGPGLFDTEPPAKDADVAAVVSALRRQDPLGERTARVLRETFDQIYDGARTGRFSKDELAKTERTHIGTLVEINLQREFQFGDGDALDFAIAGRDVDCKFSMFMGGWMIPVEAQGKVCLVLHADDERAVWSRGVVRTDLSIMGGPNRDLKRSILQPHLDKVTWLEEKAALPPNTMLLLSAEARAAIAACRPGTARVAELMRQAEGQVVNRSSVEAAAQQKDSMKRVRVNGGALDLLAPAGFLLLGGTRLLSRQVAADLELPTPPPGGFVPVRVTRAETGFDGPVANVDGVRLRRWRAGDPIESTMALVAILAAA